MMTDSLQPGPFQTPLPEDSLAGYTPRRIPVRRVERVPDANEADQGIWTRVNASYLEPLHPRHPCPPTRFRLVRTAQGIIARVECHVPPLEAFDETRLARDTVSILVWPSADGSRSPALYIEHVVSPRGFAATYCVANEGTSVEMWTPELAAEDRPRQRTTLRYSLERVFMWNADILLPWGVFNGLGDIPPAEGIAWRGNVVRIHPGEEGPRHAAWHPTPTTDHHHLGSMGEFVFPPSAAALAAAVTARTANPAKTSVRRRSSVLNRLR